MISLYNRVSITLLVRAITLHEKRTVYIKLACSQIKASDYLLCHQARRARKFLCCYLNNYHGLNTNYLHLII